MSSIEEIEEGGALLPVIAIVGRPNVGKSTLFNRLAGQRKAVVLKMPGVTRDRNYQRIKWNEHVMLLVDTGGYEPESDDDLLALIREQAQLAMDEADVILFVTDVEHPLHPTDTLIMKQLRTTQKPSLLVVNKCDNEERINAAYEFLELGVDKVYPVSASHNIGIGALMDDVIELVPDTSRIDRAVESIRVAIVGKPNVGKSTLLNAILGERRAVVSDKPGTTRDSVDTLIKRNNTLYTLIDTAGLKRRGKHKLAVERICVSASIMSLERCDVALLVCDATEGITKQDQHVAGYILEAAKAVVILINKWDLIDKSRENLKLWNERLEEAFKFLHFAPILRISAKEGKGVNRIFEFVDQAYEQYTKRISTPELNEAVTQILARHRPPNFQGREIKIKFATQVATAPPTFVFFMNFPQAIHFSYHRFVENQLRKRFGFKGTCIRIFWRKSQ